MEITDIKPLGNKVLIKPTNEDYTKTRLIIPIRFKKNKFGEPSKEPRVGEVVAVGPGKKLKDGRVIPLVTKVGDKVLYGWYCQKEILIHFVKYMMIWEDDIYCIDRGEEEEQQEKSV